jgi:hypothetical protein
MDRSARRRSPESPAMTVFATTVRRSAAPHAFVAPVVRELPAQAIRSSTGTAW